MTALEPFAHLVRTVERRYARKPDDTHSVHVTLGDIRRLRDAYNALTKAQAVEGDDVEAEIEEQS
jgi:hypothetical protein